MLQIWNDAERVAEYLERTGYPEDKARAAKIREDIRTMEAGARAQDRLERLIENNQHDCKMEEIRRSGQAARNQGEARNPPGFLREGGWAWAAWLDGWDNPSA